MAENATTTSSLDTVLAAAIRLCEYKPQILFDITTSYEPSCYSSLVTKEESKIPDSESTSTHLKLRFTGSRPEPGQRDVMLRRRITKTYLAYETLGIPHLKDVYEYCDRGGCRWTSAMTMCALLLHWQRHGSPSVSEVEDLVPLLDGLCELRSGCSTPKAWQQDDNGNLVRPTE